MKTGETAPPSRRKYRNTVQAEIAALTRERIIDASLALFEAQWLDQITLEQIAERAGVTVQTIIRHFGSKEGLFSAAGRAANDRGIEHRDEAPIGDITGAVKNLIGQYEEVGDRLMRILAQEGRYSELDALLNEGRVEHREWVERVFAPFLLRLDGVERDRLRVQLIAICDVYMWKLLRRDCGLSREQTETALQEMLTALLDRNG